MRVGAIIFSEESEILFDLNKYTDANTMAEDIKKIRYLSGGTNTQAALKLMREGFFIRSRGDRDGVDNICITLTDGESNIEAGRTIPEALLAKAAGIKMLAIGVTNSINKTELRAIASKEEYVTEVTDFGELQTVLDTILQQTCKVVEVATYGPWSAWGVCSVTCGSGVQERARTCSGQSCSGHSRETRSCGTPCPKGPVCSSKADISLVIDSSGSINQKGAGNWDLVLSFLSDLVRGLPIGPDKMRVGAIIFSEDAEILFDFNKYTDSISMAEDIRKVRYLSGGTNTQAALKLVRERLFVPSRGDRNGVDNICIVLTDGESNIQAGRTVPEALLAKAAGIKMLAIGVTNSTNQTELRAIASKDEFVTEVTDFGELETVLNTIVQQTCEAANVVEGKWNAWGEWCDCSATCGPGIVSRKRTCQTTGCQGQTKETKTCFEVACNTLAQWGPWTQWCPCTVTCGQGAQVRSRECRGSGCTGNSRESRTCQDQPCGPSGWGSWASWTACSRTCGQGSQTRVRSCPPGQTCPGTSQDTKPCQVTTCLPLVSWGQWNFWTRCSASCGRGTRRRSRTCSGQGCPGTSSETSFCDAGSCPGSWAAWQSWSACSVSCGGGRRSRERSCQGSGQCEGNSREDSACNTNPCQPTATWSEWSVWQTCSVTCGVGTTRRERSCSRPGLCSGVSAESRTCFSRTCPGSWSEWSFWQSCSATCGQGVERRLRECSRNNVCSGITEETRTCFLRQCPTVSQWSQWGNWGSCSVTCGNGQETARRFCQGGSNCPGDSTVTRACVRSPCAPAAQWGVWGSWGQCSATCGGGQQTRRRSCLTGNNCGSFTTQNQPCNTAVCPVSRWSDWSGWAQCSASCGGGQQTRQRRCLNGFNCPGNPTSSQACNTAACIVNVWSVWGNWGSCTPTCGPGMTRASTRTCSAGNCIGQTERRTESCRQVSCNGLWGPWGAWARCSSTCGPGTRTRTRRCVTGSDCRPASASSQTASCNSGQCIVDIWQSWQPWTRCSATCGPGTQTRTRTCSQGRCVGQSETENKSCNLQQCQAQWSLWGSWGACSASCGSGRQSRSRSCQGFGCVGDSSDSRNCQSAPCVVNWQPWTPWGACPVTCGQGTRARSRICPSFNSCPGSSRETGVCSMIPCPVVSIWDSWSTWTPCSATCGSGNSERRRSCTSGQCQGVNYERQTCVLRPCVGSWSNWGPWTPCNPTCGTNVQRSRTRTCQGTGCPGQSRETGMCALPVCPTPAEWGPWTPWGTCSVSCGLGSRTRTRTCSRPGACTGQSQQTMSCNNPCVAIWNPWTPWNNCPVTCGGGQQLRTRTCNGANCLGNPSESKLCNTQSCGPTTGIWTFWYPWSRCDVTCGTGRQTRTRLCPLGGCVGSSSSTRSCSAGPCAVQGTWSPWAAWSPCTNSCGGGTRSRTRTCSSIAGCGAGSNTDSQTCNTQACPAAMWLGWSNWSSCSASCSAGSRTRSRSCSAPTGCRGFGTQNEICYLGACTGPSGGTWASWSGWSACSVTCGNGIMNRARVCAPSGATCTGGSDTESSSCSLPSCGGGSWTQWGACSVTCAAGTRERLCDGNGCPGARQQPCNMGPCVIAAVTGRKGAVNDIKSCGGSLSAGKEYKNLTSSGFGEDSGDPVSDKCTWTISAPEGHIVQMNMVELEIDCVEEYWSLGERTGGPFELHACGEKEKVTAASRYATRGKTAVVVYRSVVSNRRLTGFKLHYKAVPIPQTCSEDRQTMPDKNGIIHSPNFGADTVYPVDNTCSWLITTQTGTIVELSFPKFDVTCDDHVIAYSGDIEDKPIKGRVCSPQNSTKDMFLYSSTNKMLLTFVSRGHKVGRGFIAVYRGANPGSSLVLKKKASMTKAPTDVIEDGLDRKLKELEHEWDYVADCGKLSRDGKIGKWHVTIRHKEKIICSGAIMSSKSIVTTASCVFNRTTDRYLEARHLTVHVGLKQRSSNNTTSYVASVIGHAGFDKNTGEKDIALLKLKSALSFSSTVGPICLPGLLERETVRCKAVGFLRNDKTLSTLLMDVSTRKKCISTHPDLKLTVTEGHLCVGNGTKFTGSCVGDMGSSIVCDDYGRFHLQALSLWSGADCINRPSVYLNVGTYREWLKMHIFQ